MNDSNGFDSNGSGGAGRRMEVAAGSHSRAVGSPLPVGGGGESSFSPDGESRRFAHVPPPGRALANSPGESQELPSSLQRAVNALRAALPFVQRMLPLLDGNIGSAVSNMLTPHIHTPPPAPPVNLEPLEDGLAELQAQQLDLRNQVVEQNTSLRRVEDQLELVREATDRNTLEQQELMEDLKGVGNRVNRFALFAFVLLGISVLLNVILYLHIQRVLP